MEITRGLVDFCQGINYGDLSPEVIDRTKYLALDFLVWPLVGPLWNRPKRCTGW